MRDNSIDITKGIAILFVYLGHSIIYHPIELATLYDWCHLLERSIASFNMPLFFIVSGYLFSLSKKDLGQTYKDKFLRLVIPYLFTMLIVVASKMMLPSSMSYSDGSGMLLPMLKTWLLSGGERWFVYVLFLVFVIATPIRKFLKNKIVLWSIVVGLIALYFTHVLPTFMLINDVAKFLIYFLIGFALNGKYPAIKAFKYKWAGYLLVLLLNVILIGYLCKSEAVFRFVLPFTGTLAIVFASCQLDNLGENNILVRWFKYLGKYSLQFYLFTFAYPIIRVVIVSKMGIVNPGSIILLVFILQLITSTLIVEITRRIKWFKIPCGY